MSRARRYELTPTRQQRRARRLRQVTLALAGVIALVRVVLVAMPATAATPLLAHQASASGFPAGSPIFDFATLGNGDNPTGTITFRLYEPGDTTCSNPVSTTLVPVNGNGNYQSPSFTTNRAGVYQYVAQYSGDANNDAVSTACGDPAGQVTMAKRVPTFSTQASPTVPTNGQITDTATLGSGSGPNGPTGTITFNLYGPNNLTCTPPVAFTSTVPVAGNGQYTSAPFTPTQAGTYQWVAQYSGDADNIAAGTVCVDPAEAVIVTPGGLITPTIVTTASPSVAVGGQVSDTATLSGGTLPTGSIIFTLYGPDDATCSGAPAFTSAPVAVNGNGQYNSGPFTTTAAGTFRWRASYSGDLTHNAVSTACGDPNETVVVTAPGPVTPTLITDASPSVVVGGQVTDTATLSGGNNPTGTIAFTLYGPDDATCTGAPAFTSAAVPVNGNGQYTSGPFTTTQAGTFRWVAQYNGDANNNPVATACADPNESVVVTTSPGPVTPTLVTDASPSVVVGGQVTDTATLSGGNNPTGTIVFTLYGPDDATCAGAPAFTSTAAPVNGNGQYTSGPFTTTQAGTFRWVAQYSGDANNNGVTTACADPNESVVVTTSPGPVTPTIVTNASPTVAVGGQITDTATLSGGNNPTGTITFNLFGPNDATCTGPTAFISNRSVSGNGQYVSEPFTTTQAGTFRWRAGYSGDANNNPVATACNDTNESVVVTPASTSSTSSSTSSTSSTSTSSSTTSSSTSTSTSSTSTSTSTSSTTSSTTTTTTTPPTTTAPTTTAPTTTTSSSTPPSTTSPSTSTTAPAGTQGPTTAPGLVAATSTTAAPRAPSVQVIPNQGTPGQEAVLSGSGFGSNDALTATFNSTPVVVATFRANAAGAFSATIRIPSDATPGVHTIVVTGASGRSASTPFTVVGRSTAGPIPTSAAPLARTGWPLRDPVSVAALLLVVGHCALMFGKRRKIR